jgi:endonuclease G
MKKIAFALLILFVIIGVWNFTRKINDIPNQPLRTINDIEIGNDSSIKKDSDGVIVDTEMPHILYNYLPSINRGALVSHKYYTLSYNEEFEQAEWVAYKLNTSFIKGDVKRSNSFYQDKAVQTRSAKKDDYKYSGYDRGHLLPAGDRKVSKIAMRETFYMSNISPQDPNLNRKAWKYLEEKIRKKTYAYDSLYIVTGPIIEKEHEEIGDNQVAVPSAFYKIILNYTNTSSLCATAYILPNRSVNKLTDKYTVSIDSVELVTGIDFFAYLPIDVQARFEGKDCLDL